jgi:hypothetical protein
MVIAFLPFKANIKPANLKSNFGYFNLQTKVYHLLKIYNIKNLSTLIKKQVLPHEAILVRLNTGLGDCIFCEEQLAPQKSGIDLEEFARLHQNPNSFCTGSVVLLSAYKTRPGKME